MNSTQKRIFVVTALALWSLFIFGGFGISQPRFDDIEYSAFITSVQDERVQEVLIEGQTIRGLLK